jgi:CoA:oxalate CoA-transferase
MRGFMPDASIPRGPLHGVRVLDLTRVLAGPYATLWLWELGADVIKVEIPGHGDDTRAFPPMKNGESVYFASVNRGKKSIALDLKLPDDRAIFDRLLAEADVLIENFRPGVMKRLGYDWAALHAAHPGLVYCAISGFGLTGPYRDLPAYDLVVQALSGLMSVNGPEGGPPTRLGVSLGDLGAGLFASIGVCAALAERAKSGEGRLVDIGMLDCCIALLENGLVRHLATGEIPEPLGSRHPSITPFDSFKAGDGWLVIGAANDHLFGVLTRALGHPEWSNDPRYQTMSARLENHVALKADIETVLATASAQSWIQRLVLAGVPAAPINTMPDVVANPQVQARAMIATLHDPEMGELKVCGNPIKISGYPDSPERPPAPNLDQHRPDILRALGEEAEDFAATKIHRTPKHSVW